MPTSASTGTGQVSTAGSPTDDFDGMTKDQLQDELRERDLPVSGNVDELRARLRETETTADTAVVSPDVGGERNTPDGAPVVTREEDVVGGVRVDLPPSAPAAITNPLADPNRHGIVQATRPDGTEVMVDASQPGWEERKRRIEAGEINN